MLYQRAAKVTKDCFAIAAFHMEYDSFGVTVHFKSRWLERLFRKFHTGFKKVNGRVLYTLDTSRKSPLKSLYSYPEKNTEPNEGDEGYDYADSMIIVALNKHSETLAYNSANKSKRINLSFLRLVGISAGVNVSFEGVYSPALMADVANYLDQTIENIYKAAQRILPLEPADLVDLTEFRKSIGSNTPAKSSTIYNTCISKIGLELEGAWAKNPPALANGRRLAYDGFISLHDLEGDYKIGELRSEPMDEKYLYPWLSRNLPDQVDTSCGLHVHMSLPAKYYSSLMVERFHNDLGQFLDHWGQEFHIPDNHPFWDRLWDKDEESFCGDKFVNPDMQAYNKSHNFDHEVLDTRYTRVNYCYGQHGTVEFRMLPAWDKSQRITAISAVTELVNFVRSWLSHNPEVSWTYGIGVKPANFTILSKSKRVRFTLQEQVIRTKVSRMLVNLPQEGRL